MNLLNYEFQEIKTSAKSKAIKLKMKALKSKLKSSPENNRVKSGKPLLLNNDRDRLLQLSEMESKFPLG